MDTKATTPRLLDQVRNEIRLRHYSIRTEHAYVDWTRRFVVFHNMRHPKDMGAPEIAAFLTHLATHANVAASTQNQALNALVFLYSPTDPVSAPRRGSWFGRLLARFLFCSRRSAQSPASCPA
jgi:hypothetical protein